MVPSSAAEGQEANFPRNLHNAAELFLRAGLAQNARRCIQRCSALLEVLKEGPDGKRSHSMGRGAVCWQCGHCGLPANAAECSETDIKPAPKCGACKSDAQTNFIKVVAEGAMVSARSFAPETSAKRRRSVLAREKDQCGASRER